MESLIQLNNIEKSYVMGEGERSVTTQVLHGVSLNINQGEFVAIVGQSGSGKSTLMHILGFLDTATRGAYQFDNRDVTNYDEDELSDIRSPVLRRLIMCVCLWFIRESAWANKRNARRKL